MRHAGRFSSVSRFHVAPGIASVVLALGAASSAASQAAASLVRADTVRKYFAIPEAPAFALLDAQPSRILRPGSARALAVGLVSALDGSIDLPNAFAVEASPLLLARGDRLTLDDYRRHPVHYRTRVSFATQRARARARTQIAVGVRTSLFDRTDPRTDDALLSRLHSLLERHARNDDSLDARIEAAGLNLLAVDRGDVTPAQRRVVDSLRALHDATERSLDAAFAARIASWREDSVWNRPVLDVALGARWSARDSVGHALRADRYAAWATYGTGHRGWLQWLIGVQAALDRDSVTGRHDPSGAITTRLYAGANRYKVFGEVQGEAIRHRAPVWLWGGGSELALDRAIWLVAYAGWLDPGAEPGRLITRLGFALGAR